MQNLCFKLLNVEEVCKLPLNLTAVISPVTNLAKAILGMLGEHLWRQLACHVTLLIYEASCAPVKRDKILHRHRASRGLNDWTPCCLPLVGKKSSISSIITPSPPKHVSQVHFLPKLSYRKIPFFLSSAETATLVTRNPCVGVVHDCKGNRWSQAEKSGI